MTLWQISFAALAFISGSLPFSVWIGRVVLKQDIRRVGDGNPGTFNVLRAGGIKWGVLALMLDISKGAAPVGLANYMLGFEGTALIVVAIAPVFGHAFSPFLRFRGGKAIATTAGIWIGLTLWPVPLVGMAALTLAYITLTVSAWAVIVMLIAALVYLLLADANTTLMIVWTLNAALLVYKHWSELLTLPRLRFTQSVAAPPSLPDSPA